MRENVILIIAVITGSYTNNLFTIIAIEVHITSCIPLNDTCCLATSIDCSIVQL